MKVNAVFEGGGVKAIALVGAIKEAEMQGFTFDHVAGTSSGSLVAAFLAAGYTADDMKQMILDMPFKNFLQRSWIFNFKVVGPITRIFIKKGMYSGEVLEHWVHQKLLQKGISTFGDLEENKLRIIASDITDGKLLVLPNDIAQYGIDPKRFAISKAVRMSTSIPYFFDPVMIRRNIKMRKKKINFRNEFVYIVDGGILSNYPLWIFDKKEISLETGKIVPTLGFQLVGKNTQDPHEINGPFSMFQALFSTMMDAHDERFIEDHNRFRTIKIPAIGVHTTEFDISKEKSLKLYENGRQAADYFFKKWSKQQYLNKFEQYVVKRFEK